MKLRPIFLVLLVSLWTCSCTKEFMFSDLNPSGLRPVQVLEGQDISILAGPVFDYYGGVPVSDAGFRGDFAVVVNDKSLLQDVTWGDEVYRWPELDLKRHSLVICRYGVCDPGKKVASQRIKKQIGQNVLLLEITQSPGGAIAQPWVYIFAALYPRMTGGPVEVRRWDNYPNGLAYPNEL